MKKLLCLILLFSIVLTGCSFNKSDNNKTSSNNSANSADSSKSTPSNSTENNLIDSPTDNKQNDEAENLNSQESSNSAYDINNNSNIAADNNNNNNNNDDSDKNIDMVQEVKNYILYGQSDKSSAEQLKWSEDFLNKEDIATIYDEYLTNGGTANDVPAFASYLTLNAPILDNWQELFEKNLYDSYGYEVSKLEDLGDGYYQAYVIVDGQEVPYVTVNARTGYYHG